MTLASKIGWNLSKEAPSSKTQMMVVIAVLALLAYGALTVKGSQGRG